MTTVAVLESPEASTDTERETERSPWDLWAEESPAKVLGTALLDPRAASDDDKDEDEAYFEGDDEDEYDDDDDYEDGFDEFDDDFEDDEEEDADLDDDDEEL